MRDGRTNVSGRGDRMRTGEDWITEIESPGFRRIGGDWFQVGRCSKASRLRGGLRSGTWGQ